MATTIHSPANYSDWADRQTQAGEKGDLARALIRRIKMHEFVASGGLVTSSAKDGIVTYGPPVDFDAIRKQVATIRANPHDNMDDEIAEALACPWHGEGCQPWFEIIEGRGYGAVDGPTLRELRERTPDEIEEARKADAVERIAREQNVDRVVAKRVSDKTDNLFGREGRDGGHFQRNRFEEREAAAAAAAAADLAVLAEAADSLGDEIVFDGDEDEEVEMTNDFERDGVAVGDIVDGKVVSGNPDINTTRED